MFANAVEQYLMEKTVFQVTEERWFHTQTIICCDAKKDAIAKWKELTGIEYSEATYEEYLKSINRNSDSYHYYRIRSVALWDFIQLEMENVKHKAVWEESKKIQERAEEQARAKVRKEFQEKIRKALEEIP